MVKWESIPDYEGYYEVSDDGQVRSVDRLVNTKGGGKRAVKGKYLSPYSDKDGYLRIELNKKGKAKKHFVHRLIAIAFIDNSEEKPQINHINGDKTDNKVSNLEWVTLSENRTHALDKLNKGQVKLTPDDVREIRRLISLGMSNVDIAKKFDIDDSTVCCIKRGHRWSRI